MSMLSSRAAALARHRADLLDPQLHPVVQALQDGALVPSADEPAVLVRTHSMWVLLALPADP